VDGSFLPISLDLTYQGPNNTDDFTPVTIRNIQRKRVNVPFVTAGQSASFALKKVRRQDIRKGMVMLQKTDTPPVAVREFIAEGNLNKCSDANVSYDLVPSNDNQAEISGNVTCQRDCSNLSDHLYPYNQSQIKRRSRACG
jgi:hypothetical protein